MLLTICTFASLCAYAQFDLNRIDLSHIRQSSVRDYIAQQKAQQVDCFSDLQASVHQGDDLTKYMDYEKVYLIKEPVDVVWDNYKFSNQTDVWETKSVSFGMAFCRASQSVVYADEFFYGMEKGQIYFLNLKILNGLYHLPVAFEIITVDRENRLFEFSYLKGGKAEGKQSIQLVETPQGYTKIIHKSYVRSGSKFRDKYLYPFFHNKLIKEFHSNMRRVIVYNSKNPLIKTIEVSAKK